MGQRLFNAFPFSVCKQLAQPRRLHLREPFPMKIICFIN